MFQLQLEKEQLLPLLSLVVGACAERKLNMPILANILFIKEDGLLQCIGTDTEIEVIAQASINDTSENQERVTVNAKKILDVCRSLPEKALIRLEEKDNKLIVQSGRSRFAIATLPATDFPNITETSQSGWFSLQAPDLKYLLQSTSFAMTQEDIRVYLNGLLFEKNESQLLAAATDGHRLAVCHIPLLDESLQDFRIVLPRKGILELIKLLDTTGENAVQIMVSNNHFYVKGENYTFITKQLNCQYPQYRSVIPQNTDKIIRLEKDALKMRLQRVAVLAQEKKRGVCFHLGNNLLKISVNNAEQEMSEDEMEVLMEGETFEIHFNIGYIMDVLNNLPSMEIKMSCANPEQGILFESDVVSQVQYVVMPMKV